MGTSSPDPAVVPTKLRVSEIISALSFALDLTEGQPMGHSINSCLIGIRLGKILRLTQTQLGDLYFANLLKDAGCSSNASRMFQIFGGDDLKAKREAKTTDWSHLTFDGLNHLLRNVMPGRSALERVLAISQITLNHSSQTKELMEIRCQRGAQIALRLGFSQATAEAIRDLDEQWDGAGFPRGLKGTEISLLARIVSLCQTLEVFAMLNGPSDAFQILRQRRGTWFDPDIVDAAGELEADSDLWASLQDGSARPKIIAMQPEVDMLPSDRVQDDAQDDAQIDRICSAFGDVVDAKSPYTYEHSARVTSVAVAIGNELGLGAKDKLILRRAALLHDVGKLSVPNSILDKAGPLSATEWETIRLHPYYTQRILERIPGFSHLAFIASSHHERLNGSGYYRNLRESQLPLETRALVVADIFDALSSPRAYRSALPLDQVFDIMARDVPHALDARCFEALKAIAPSLPAHHAQPESIHEELLRPITP